MKKIITAVFTVIFFINCYPQFIPQPTPCNGMFDGGMGLNWIDGELYYTFHLRPEIALGNFGVGLDLTFDINRNGNIRKENFNSITDYLSIIRYVRYGVKNDPVYIKLGALDYYTLGHGSIISLYNNSPSYDARKIGLVTDIDFGNFGFESIYSDFAQAGIVGIRGYVRPLKFSSAGEIPIIGNFEVGATYAGDFNRNAGIISGHFDRTANKFISDNNKGVMNIVGLDAGLPIISTGMLKTVLYADYSKIINFGSGVATGIMVNLNGLGLVNASVKLERRFNNKRYIASYFNSLYELQRFQVDTASGTFSSKAETLNNLVNPDNGYFGELNVNILGSFYIIGSYERLDKTPNSGELHIEGQVAPETLPFLVSTGYDKINIRNEKDLFTLDDRSYLYFEFGYKPLPYLVVSMLYKWTFSPIYDANNHIIDYRPQKRIEPRVSFVFPFSVCQM